MVPQCFLITSSQHKYVDIDKKYDIPFKGVLFTLDIVSVSNNIGDRWSSQNSYATAILTQGLMWQHIYNDNENS